MGCGLEGGQKEEGGRAGEPGGPQSWAAVRALEGSRQNGLVLLLQAGPAASHHGFHLGTCQKCRLTESQSAAFQGPQVIQMHIRIGDAQETTGYLPITKQSLTFTHQGAVVRLGLSAQPHTSPGEVSLSSLLFHGEAETGEGLAICSARKQWRRDSNPRLLTPKPLRHTLLSPLLWSGGGSRGQRRRGTLRYPQGQA